MQNIFLTANWQSNTQNSILLLLFLVIAVIFLVIFFYWWRKVSEDDLDDIIEADANQTTGPATFGEVPADHAEAEAAAEADREILEETLHPHESETADDAVAAEETVESAGADVELKPELEPVQPDDLRKIESAGADVEPKPEPEPVQPDDLRKIEGIGPKISGLLHDAGILTFAQLAASEPEQIKQILTDAGPRYQLANPASWPEQAKLAADGDWDGLQELQDRLTAGRH